MAGGGNVGADLQDRLPIEEHVGLALAVRVDDGAILDQGGHRLVRTSRGAAGGALRPALRGEPVVDPLHGDAAVHRADQRAEIATDTVLFIHPGNTLQRGDRIGMAQAGGSSLGIGVVEMRRAASASTMAGVRVVSGAGEVRSRWMHWWAPSQQAV